MTSPDYTTELQKIATALSRIPPWWQHPWVLAAFASMLGVVGGFVGQILLLRYTASTKLRTMRNMVYNDIVALFAVIDTTLSFSADDSSDTPQSEQSQAHRREHFKLVAPRMSDDYIKANPEVYAKLPERLPSEGLYNMYRHLLTEPEDFDAYLLSVNQMISQHFKMNRLTLGAVRKYVGKEAAETLAPILARYEPDVSKLGASK